MVSGPGDANDNDIPDECEELVCPPDLDGSGDVGFSDLLIVLDAWGTSGGLADLDGDGTVGFGDLLMVLDAWGAC